MTHPKPYGARLRHWLMCWVFYGGHEFPPLGYICRSCGAKKSWLQRWWEAA